MENKANKFGYVMDCDIKDVLKFPESLRGCNKGSFGDLTELYRLDFVPDEILNMLPVLDLNKLPRGINSFTYQRLTVGNNDAIEKYVYASLVLADLGRQIEDCLIKNDACVVSFDNYVNEDYEALGDYTVLIRAFKDVLVFRGYHVIEETNGLVVINCDSRITKDKTNMLLESLEGKNIVIDVTDRLAVEKEELIYRGIAELLATTVRYSNLTGIWMNCKERIENMYDIEFNDIYRVAYNAFYVYACLNSYEDLDGEKFKIASESNLKILNDSIEVDEIDELLQLGVDLEDCYYVNNLDPVLNQNEHSIGIEVLQESLEKLEVIMDEYFSPEMLPIRCTRLYNKDLQLFSYELLKTKRGMPEPISIPTVSLNNNEIEELDLEEYEEEFFEEEEEDIKGKKKKKKQKEKKEKHKFKKSKKNKYEDSDADDEMDYEEYEESKHKHALRRYLPVVAITIIVLVLARLATM
ncbi:hypothetical protein UT300012_22700 [Paraclostridium bifermentans]